MNKDYTNKFDEGKPMLGLVPPELIEGVGEILTYGANKYSLNSWQKVEPERYIDAMMRHMCKFLRDPFSIDEESGYTHLKHMACNIAFLMHFYKEK